jgi:hypothetical protein
LVMGVERSYNGTHEMKPEVPRAEGQVKVSTNFVTPLVCSFRTWMIGVWYLLRNKCPVLLL